MQNILKFKHAVITGIVGVICTRHGLFFPRGIADMPRGEAYVLLFGARHKTDDLTIAFSLRIGFYIMLSRIAHTFAG